MPSSDQDIKVKRLGKEIYKIFMKRILWWGKYYESHRS